MSNLSPPPSATAVTVGGGDTTISDLHADILNTQILTRLDGPTLASASCTSSQLHSLSAKDHLWTSICHSTWPSTTTPRLRHIISTLPGGSRFFFSLAFPLLLPTSTNTTAPPPQGLISAVDIHYKNNLIFTKVQETETVSDWFCYSPFRIDLLDPKDVISTSVRHPDGDDAFISLATDMTLSWVLIDPVERRVANLSSYKPVSFKRHCLNGEVEVKFASILARGEGAELVQCRIVVTCCGSESGGMEMREVSLQVEDMDGMHLTGKDSLIILHRAIDGKRLGNKRRNEEGRKKYGDYLAMKRARRQKRLRNERRLDMICVALGVTFFCWFLGFLTLVLIRRNFTPFSI